MEAIQFNKEVLFVPLTAIKLAAQRTTTANGCKRLNPSAKECGSLRGITSKFFRVLGKTFLVAGFLNL
jgi:hypothetical protein